MYTLLIISGVFFYRGQIEWGISLATIALIAGAIDNYRSKKKAAK